MAVSNQDKYFRKAFTGLSWMGALRGLIRILAFIKLAILARLLLPEQFGIYGIAALVLSFLEIFTETGINVFFVQGEGRIKEYINIAWVVSILRGILISLLILLTAPYVAVFFNTPDAVNVLMLISIVPLLRGFINPAIVTYQKELQFNKEFNLRLITYVVDAGVAVLFAFMTREPSSLVWGLAAGTITEIVLSFAIISPRPKLEIEIDKAKKVINRGKWVTFAGIFEYSFQQGDDIVVGRLMNASALGVYQNAYKISTLPITEITAVFGKVAFPIYAKINNDLTRLRRNFLKITFIVMGLAIPFGIFLFAFPELVVRILLGENWLEAVPVIRVLAVYGTIRAIVVSPYTLFLALKKQEYVTISTLSAIIGLGLTIIPLVSLYGLVGAGYSTIIGSLVSLPVVMYFTIRSLSK